MGKLYLLLYITKQQRFVLCRTLPLYSKRLKQQRQKYFKTVKEKSLTAVPFIGKVATVIPTVTQPVRFDTAARVTLELPVTTYCTFITKHTSKSHIVTAVLQKYEICMFQISSSFPAQLHQRGVCYGSVYTRLFVSLSVCHKSQLYYKKLSYCRGTARCVS